MKNLCYLLMAGGLYLSSCQQQPTYTINGSIEEGSNGEFVYMQEIKNDSVVKLDSAVINNGTFVFEGRQDSIINVYLTYSKDSKKIVSDLFLENGIINVSLGDKCSTAGTTNNDIYQQYKDRFLSIKKEINNIVINAQKDSNMSADTKDSIMAVIQNKETLGIIFVQNTIERNIKNAVGIHLFTQFSSLFDEFKKGDLLKMIPEEYSNNPAIIKLTQKINKTDQIKEGDKFVDFSMADLDGNTIKISDFIGRNKYTLIDFWASWCGPCRKEIPHLIEVYKNYKSKGFEIIGVSLDDKETKWKDAVNNMNLTWIQLSDLKGWANEGAKLYGVTSVPSTVLISQDGTIIAKNIRGEELKQKLSELLNN